MDSYSLRLHAGSHTTEIFKGGIIIIIIYKLVHVNEDRNIS